jgi:hypothetical protein
MGHFFSLVLATLLIASSGMAQELEPRRWSHLPTGLNFAGMGYAYTEADISDSPALRLEQVEMEMHTFAAKYIRTFDLFGKSARIDLAQAYQKGSWNGVLDGTPASTDRTGWSDSFARFSINLYGAPPLSGKAYADYRANTEVETIVGAALGVQFPTGEYMEERLINLGNNRFTFRPQLGVVHMRGKWTMEASTAAWIYTENNDFYQDTQLEKDPLYTVQGHLIYTWEPGLWAGLSLGYAAGGRSTLNGEEKDDRREIGLLAVSLGYPVTRDWGLKVAYVGTRRFSTNGRDTDSVVLTVSHFW